MVLVCKREIKLFNPFGVVKRVWWCLVTPGDARGYSYLTALRSGDTTYNGGCKHLPYLFPKRKCRAEYCPAYLAGGKYFGLFFPFSPSSSCAWRCHPLFLFRSEEAHWLTSGIRCLGRSNGVGQRPGCPVKLGMTWGRVLIDNKGLRAMMAGWKIP